MEFTQLATLCNMGILDAETRGDAVITVRVLCKTNKQTSALTMLPTSLDSLHNVHTHSLPHTLLWIVFFLHLIVYRPLTIVALSHQRLLVLPMSGTTVRPTGSIQRNNKDSNDEPCSSPPYSRTLSHTHTQHWSTSSCCSLTLFLGLWTVNVTNPEFYGIENIVKLEVCFKESGAIRTLFSTKITCN